MAQATSYNVAGNREDLTDLLTILEPEDTPLLSSLKKSKKATGVYQEWQVDNLAAPTFGGVLDGSDVSSFENKAINRARVGTYIQKERKSWSVSDIQELVDTAGVDSEVANSKAKCVREIKRDIEAALGSDQEMQADNGTVPYKTRGLGKWIQSTAQSTNPVPTAYLTPAASINATATGSLDEATFNGVFQSIYEQNGGKRNYMLFAGPALKKAISNFQRATGTSGTTKTYQVTQNAKDHAIDLNVEIYRGDFHDVAVVPTLFNGRTSGSGIDNTVRARGYVIDPDLVGYSYMKGIESAELQNEGGGRRGYVDAIFNLVVKNPLGLGKFAASS